MTRTRIGWRYLAFVALGAICISFTASLWRARGQSISPLNVGTDAQLFIDHRFIESCENIAMKVNQPVLPEGDVLTYENPWEAGAGVWATVREDGGTYKMWYDTYAWDAKTRRRVDRFNAMPPREMGSIGRNHLLASSSPGAQRKTTS